MSSFHLRLSAINRALLAGCLLAPVVAVANPDLPSERHARCGFDREIAAVQVSGQRVNREIMETEPPPRDLEQLGCYDQIKGIMASITAFGTLPGPVTSLLSGFACDAIQSSAEAVNRRWEEFSQTPFGGGVVSGINGGTVGLPVSSTPGSFLSQPPPPVQPVSDPRFEGGAHTDGSRDGMTRGEGRPGLPQGSSTNIFQQQRID